MAYDIRTKGIINQVISDIKKISEDRKYHFAVARDMNSGKVPIYSVLDVYPEVASLGFLQSLAPDAKQEIMDSPELEEKDWETFRQYAALLEKQGITQQLVHSYPELFPDSLLRRIHYCFLSFSQEKKKFFLKSEFKGETIKKEIDLEALEKIGSQYLDFLEKQDHHYEKTGKAISCEKEFKRLGKQLFNLFLTDEWIANGLKRIYVNNEADMEASPHQHIFEALPFEILYSHRYHFLSINRRIPVIRSYSHAPLSKVAAIGFPFKLLVIISNPPGLGHAQKINVEREKRIFYKTLDPWVYEGKLEIDVIDIATHGSVTDKLRKHRFDAVHFLGHGFDKGILLESEDGGQETVSCEKFASLFAGRSIKLFFLTSCLTAANTPANQYSSTVRELRKIGIPVVVGMSRPLTYDAAEILVREFYLTFFQPPDHSLTDAYTLSLNKISFDPHPLVSANAFIPVLYLPLEFETFQWEKPGEGQSRLYHKFEFLGSLKTHTTGCFGREDQLRRAKKALQNPNHRILIVKGFGGIGKSAFIYWLLRDLYSEYDCFFVKEFRMEAEDRDYTIDNFSREMAGCLEREGDTGLRELLAGENDTYDIPAVIKYIAGAVERLRMLVVLDNLEQLLERGQDGKFRFKDENFMHLMEEVMKAASGIRLIVGTREGFACPSFETAPALKYEIALSTIDDAESAVDIAKEADPDLTEEKQDALVRYSGGFPLLIQVMADPDVSAVEIREMGMESLARAAGNEKVSRVFQYFDGHLQGVERNALFSLSFANLAFDRGLVEKFIDGSSVDPLLRRPVFRKMSSTALYILPEIIGSYFIDTYRSRYNGKALNKIHQTIADYYRRVLDEVSTSKPSSQAWQRYLIINGSHLPGRMIKHVINLYLKAKNYRKTRDITVYHFKHLLDTGNALFLEPVLTMLKEKIKKPDEVVDFLLARVSDELYKFDQSLELYLSLLDRIYSKEKKAFVFQLIGNLYDRRRKDYSEALRWYRKSLEISEEIGDKKGLANTYNVLGIMYFKRSDFGESIHWYQRSARIREEIGDREGIASTYYQLGLTYDSLGDYSLALKWYQKNLEIIEEMGDQKGISATYNQLGRIYSRQQDYERALQCYQKSANIQLKMGDRKGLALTYLYLGIMYVQIQNYDEALRWYRKSADICKEISYIEVLAMVYDNLGNTYHQLGMKSGNLQNYEAAIDWYQKSVKILKKQIGARKGLANTYHELGITYDKLQDYVSALCMYQKSAAIFEEAGYKRELSTTYHQIGSLYENKQEYDIALEWYDKSFTLAKEIKDFKGMIFTLAQKSLLYFNMENYREALINILSAITFAENDAPHLLKQVQGQLQYFYDQLGEEKSREILDSL